MYYTGTIAEILEALRRRRLSLLPSLSLFSAAVAADHTNLVTAILQYYTEIIDPSALLQLILLIYKKSDIKGMRVLIETLLKLGAKPNSIDYLPTDLLYVHREAFLSNIKPEYRGETLLRWTLHSTARASKLYENLIEAAYSDGANLCKITDGINSEALQALANTVSKLKACEGNNLLQLVQGIIIHSATSIKIRDLLLRWTREALESGADVNITYYDQTLFELALEWPDPELLRLLKSYAAVCRNLGIEEAEHFGLSKIFDNPNFVLEQKHKNLNASRSSHPKIPLIVNHLYITNRNSPKKMRTIDLNRIVDLKKKFSQNWKHIMWTNVKGLILDEMLQAHKVEVRSIYDSQYHLRFIGVIEEMINRKALGMASDILKYSIIEHTGGVYEDLDFTNARDVEQDNYKYNFFSMAHRQYQGIYMANYFFAASPHHPIIRHTLELSVQNSLSPPPYISSVKNQNLRFVTVISTANPLTLAYLKYANHNNTTDIVYPCVKGSGLCRDPGNQSKYLEQINGLRGYCSDPYVSTTIARSRVLETEQLYSTYGSRLEHLPGQDMFSGTWKEGF
jgi:hypothetical protein